MVACDPRGCQWRQRQEEGMSRSSTRRWVRGGGAVLLFAAAAALGGAPAGAGGSLGNYTGVATASGTRATFIVPGEFAVEEVFDAGGPLAQSRLGPGTADGFASFPYPGGLAVAYQGLLNIATGISSPFAYPFYVSASQPNQPSQELADPSGAYVLRAAAGPGAARSTARLRPGAPDAFLTGTEAATSVVAGDDSVVATATSLAEGLTLGQGLLSIGSVASRSVTTLAVGQAAVTGTDLTVTGLRVGDKRIGVGPAGFELLGTPVPLSSADVEKVVNGTLAPAGLRLHFVAPQSVAGGAQAAALEIVSHQAPPNMPASDVTIRLGGALSAITRGEGTVPLPDTGSLPPAAGAGAAPGDAGGAAGGNGPASGAPATPAGADAVASANGAAGAGDGRPAPPASPAPAFGSGSGAGSASTAAGAGATGTGAFAPLVGGEAAGAPVPAAAAASGTTTLQAQPVFAPRRVSSIGVLYAVAAALGLSAVVGAGSWAIRGRWLP